ncbi:hypothetical protein HNY73_023143 [Argiope bruennichi]|uniref:DUF5641 domain-containing protein n=1 Tax=Argiope bruennichi TaxID=94029 RepID=A0A8T0E3Z2_ARGBR|nr:hypothetical protein HNY73_023143 [Argiope bruennichi]
MSQVRTCDETDFAPLKPIIHTGDEAVNLVSKYTTTSLVSRQRKVSGNRRVAKEFGVPDLNHLDRTDFNKRLRHLQGVRELLRRRFRLEYLSLLVQRPSTILISRQIKIGDIVLVECDNKRKVLWPLSKVTEIYPGKDGNVRVVRVKTASGELVRPIKKISPPQNTFIYRVR